MRYEVIMREVLDKVGPIPQVWWVYDNTYERWVDGWTEEEDAIRVCAGLNGAEADEEMVEA